MGKQEDVALSVWKSKHGKARKRRIVCWRSKEILWELFTEHKRTLFAIFSNSTKLIDQRLDKRKTKIIDINVEISKNIKDVDELEESLQMYEETNDKKLVEVDNSLRKKTERK